MIAFRNDDERQLWRQVVLAFINASNSTRLEGAILWADEAIREYRDRNGEVRGDLPRKESL